VAQNDTSLYFNGIEQRILKTKYTGKTGSRLQNSKLLITILPNSKTSRIFDHRKILIINVLFICFQVKT